MKDHSFLQGEIISKMCKYKCTWTTCYIKNNNIFQEEIIELKNENEMTFKKKKNVFSCTFFFTENTEIL